MIFLLREALIQLKRFFRQKASATFSFLFQTLVMVLFGMVNRGSLKGGAYSRFVGAGILAIAIMSTCTESMTGAIVADRVKGIFRRLFVTPLARYQILGGHIIARYIICFMQAVIVFAIGAVLVELGIKGSALLLWLVMTIGIFSFLSIGFFLSTIAKTAEGGSAIAHIFFFANLILGCIFIPFQVMPQFLHPVIHILPGYHLATAIRLITLEGLGLTAIKFEMLGLMIWGIVSFIVSLKFFKWE